MRTLQDIIDELRGNDLPYGDLIVEVAKHRQAERVGNVIVTVNPVEVNHE